MAEQVREPAAQPDNPVQSLEPKWWGKRAHSPKLYTHSKAHAYLYPSPSTHTQQTKLASYKNVNLQCMTFCYSSQSSIQTTTKLRLYIKKQTFIFNYYLTLWQSEYFKDEEIPMRKRLKQKVERTI